MNKLTRRARFGLGAVVVSAALVIAPAVSANAAIVPTVGSAHDVFLLDVDGGQLPVGSSQLWNADVFASPESSDPDFNSKFAIPAGATSVRTFISSRTNESNRSMWNASGPLALTAGGILQPNFKPFGNTTAEAATPSGAGAVAQAGGDYSLGIAFLNSSNAVIEVDFTYITVVANAANPALATWTFATPAGPVAPAIATGGNPASVSKLVGQTATFTAAATGTPTPTVKWQSAPSGSSTFTDLANGGNVSGATTNTLSIANVQVAATGTQYRAVYTNAGGSATTTAAVLTVGFDVPTQPVPGDPNQLANATATYTAGNYSLTLTGTSIPAGTYSVWAWSTPTQLPNATVNGSGNVTFNLNGLTPGQHTLAIVNIATNQIVGWLLVTIPQPPNTSGVNLTVDVTTTNKFALEGVASALFLGSAPRGGTTSADLPAFTVTDDRDTLPGWDLTSSVANFVNDGVAVPANLGDVIDKSALKVTPHKVGAAITGINVAPLYTAGASNLFAEGLVNTSTPSTGTQFNATLGFTVPSTAKKGTYGSVLTLTLTSK